MNKTKLNIWIDCLIFTAFLLAGGTGLLFRFALLPAQAGGTWEAVHYWAGGALLALILLHLVLHWKWIVTVAGRFLKKTSRQARINFGLDLLLFGVFTLICLSGLVNLFVLTGMPARQSSTANLWYIMHRNTGTVILVYVSVHLGLHWKWIKKTLQDLLEEYSVRQKGIQINPGTLTNDRRTEPALGLRRDDRSK